MAGGDCVGASLGVSACQDAKEQCDMPAGCQRLRPRTIFLEWCLHVSHVLPLRWQVGISQIEYIRSARAVRSNLFIDG